LPARIYVALPEYIVKIVREELRELWHEYWDKKPKTQRARNANRDGSLGQTTIIKARNAKEAAEIAVAQNPGYIVIPDATKRFG
jgi:hypothetical protein